MSTLGSLEESPVPLGSHGNRPLSRQLTAGGHVFPGKTEMVPIFAAAADFHLNPIEHRTFDGRTEDTNPRLSQPGENRPGHWCAAKVG
jgi:hypothetical protein